MRCNIVHGVEKRTKQVSAPVLAAVAPTKRVPGASGAGGEESEFMTVLPCTNNVTLLPNTDAPKDSGVPHRMLAGAVTVLLEPAARR